MHPMPVAFERRVADRQHDQSSRRPLEADGMRGKQCDAEDGHLRRCAVLATFFSTLL